MIRSIRPLILGFAAAAALTASPAFAQKTTGGPTSVIEVEKAARTAVNVHFTCEQFAADEYTTCSTTYQVPTGMRLVLQDIMLGGSSANGAMYAFLQYALDGESNAVVIPPTYTAGNLGFTSRQVPTYLDAVQSFHVYGGVASSQPLVFVTAYLVKK